MTAAAGATDRDAGVRWTVRHAHEGSAWFRAHLDRAGVDVAAVDGVADLPALPFTTKADLRDAYPFGWTAVPMDDVVRVHASSGTTGKRTVATYTAADVDDWATMFARCYELAGVTAADRVQVTPGYGLWTAGIGFQAGAERLGATAVPTGPGNVDLQFEVMVDFATTVLCATSSFALLLAEEAHARGLADRLCLRTGVLGSERWGPAMRARIESLLGVETFDVYGLTELYGPGMGLDCEAHEGIHYWDDYFVVEVVDPDTGTALPPGEEGEVVLTTLRKEATPLLRYRTRDLSRVLPEPCRCGRPWPRIARLTGRTDDMVKVRGVAVFPARVDTALSAVEGLGSEYQLHLSREAGRDVALVRVEAAAPGAARQPAALAEAAAGALRDALGLRVEVDVVEPGALPRTDRKTRRVFDHRT